MIPPPPTQTKRRWLLAGRLGLPTLRTPVPTTSLQSLSPVGAHFETHCQKAQNRMVEQRGRKMTRPKNPNGVPDLSLCLSHHLNLRYSSPRPSTPASHPTRATSAPRFALQTTLSPCPHIRHRPSSALSARAQASTSLRSCHLQLAVRACHRPQHPNQPRAACCVPTAATLHHQFL